MPAVDTLLAGRRTRLAVLGGGLVSGVRHTFQRWEVRQGRCRLSPAPLSALLREKRLALAGVAGQLEAVSPKAVLARGYALVSVGGQAVTSAAALRGGQNVALTFADGTREATISHGNGGHGQGEVDL